jgi:hypothetical protein
MVEVFWYAQLFVFFYLLVGVLSGIALFGRDEGLGFLGKIVYITVFAIVWGHYVVNRLIGDGD